MKKNHIYAMLLVSCAVIIVVLRFEIIKNPQVSNTIIGLVPVDDLTVNVVFKTCRIIYDLYNSNGKH